MLLTEGGMNDQLSGSDVDQEQEPRRIQTEPFELADECASCNEIGEESGMKFISDMGQDLKLTLVSGIERAADDKLNEDALDFNELIGQEGSVSLKQPPGHANKNNSRNVRKLTEFNDKRHFLTDVNDANTKHHTVHFDF